MEISGAVPDETMRVLHILPSLKQTYGGPTRAVLDLSARAAEFGLQGEILGFGELDIADNPLPRHLIHALPIKTPKQYCYSPALRPWLRENLGRFDGVVLHGMWMYPNWAEMCIRDRSCSRFRAQPLCLPTPPTLGCKESIHECNDTPDSAIRQKWPSRAKSSEGRNQPLSHDAPDSEQRLSIRRG